MKFITENIECTKIKLIFFSAFSAISVVKKHEEVV